MRALAVRTLRRSCYSAGRRARRPRRLDTSCGFQPSGDPAWRRCLLARAKPSRHRSVRAAARRGRLVVSKATTTPAPSSCSRRFRRGRWATSNGSSTYPSAAPAPRTSRASCCSRWSSAAVDGSAVRPDPVVRAKPPGKPTRAHHPRAHRPRRLREPHGASPTPIVPSSSCQEQAQRRDGQHGPRRAVPIPDPPPAEGDKNGEG